MKYAACKFVAGAQRTMEDERKGKERTLFLPNGEDKGRGGDCDGVDF